MHPSRILALALLMTPLFTASAHAFSVQDSSGSGRAANLADPDDSIPYPHIADDGQMQQGSAGGVQFQSTANPVGLSFTGPTTQPSSAFNRAVDNMGQ